MEQRGTRAVGESPLQLTVAVFNSCHYCTAAHVAIGKQVGIAQEDLEAIMTSGLLLCPARCMSALLQAGAAGRARHV